MTGMKTWQCEAIGDTKVTAVPAVHLVTTVGYVIEGEGLQVYFAGDTFYGSYLRKSPGASIWTWRSSR